jgi:hypothetical protein
MRRTVTFILDYDPEQFDCTEQEFANLAAADIVAFGDCILDDLEGSPEGEF